MRDIFKTKDTSLKQTALIKVIHFLNILILIKCTQNAPQREKPAKIVQRFRDTNII